MSNRKRTAFAGLLFSGLLLMTSCSLNASRGSTSSSTSSTSGAPSTSSKKASAIQIVPPDKKEYRRGDAFDISGLSVSLVYEDGTKEAASDYTLTFSETGEEIVNGDILDYEDGTHTITVAVTGVGFASFDISTWTATPKSRYLDLTSLPTKTIYIVKNQEAFSSEGLGAIYTVIFQGYLNGVKKTEQKDTTVTDLVTFSIDGKTLSEGDVFTVDDYGTKAVTVTYSEDGKTVTAVFYITIISGDTAPKEYTDTTNPIVTGSNTIKLTITNPNSAHTTGTNNYIAPDDVDATKYSIPNYYAKKNYENWRYLPTTGKVPLLIVPVFFTDQTQYDTTANRDLMKKCFFGKSTDLNFESLHSYYYKSSYGKLDFTGSIAPSFYPQVSIPALKSTSTESFNEVSLATMLTGLPDYLKTLGYDLTQYDSDSDGYLDSVWMIYGHSTEASSTSNWWAYSSTLSVIPASVASPTVNNYGWTSFDFLNDDFSGGSSIANAGGDAHVLIHETGHLLGLSDYYSYYSSTYDPLGGYDMMAYNVGDHNPYSKLLYGWVDPYLVYGNSTITLSLNTKNNHQVVLIPYDSKDYSDTKYQETIQNADGTTSTKTWVNPYDEYMILDFYTNANMDSQSYDCYKSAPINGTGVRIYHADHRLFKASGIITTVTEYSNPDTPLSTTDLVNAAINNSEGGDRAESGFGLPTSYDAFDELRLIAKDKSILDLYATQKTYKGYSTAPSVLFKAGSSFSLSSYSASFPKTTTFNNGKSFSYNISFSNN